MSDSLFFRPDTSRGKVECRVCGVRGWPTDGDGWQRAHLRGHGPCPKCGKVVTLTRSGTPRPHARCPQHGEKKQPSLLPAPDGIKMTRETLCAAQAALLQQGDTHRRNEHVDRLQRLIFACDEHRPLGLDLKHGNRHTSTCGCEDK